MKNTLLAIIGEYVSNDALEGVASFDIPWICSALLFTCLVCVTAWFACRVIVGVLHD